MYIVLSAILLVIIFYWISKRNMKKQITINKLTIVFYSSLQPGNKGEFLTWKYLEKLK